MTAPTAKSVLKSNFLFRDLPEAIIDRLAALAINRSYPKDYMIFSQGDEGDALYGVCAGKVRISSSAADATEVFLNIMGPGDTFGEIALIDGQPRTASATTMSPSVLVVIQRDPFLALLETEPTLAVHLLTLFCERLRSVSEMVEDSAFLPVPERLAKRLLNLAKHHGTEIEQGTELDISQSELAHFLSISRQIVNRYLQDWQKSGWVSLTRGKIRILDSDALRRAFTNIEPGN